MIGGDYQCPMDELDEEYKLTIGCLPAEILAICLSYTGEDLTNARLTCRRFNQIIEDYQYMMNVIPVDKMMIGKYQSRDFLAIEVTGKCYMHIVSDSESETDSDSETDSESETDNESETTCKLDELMQYVRFFRPRWLYIAKHLEATDMKKYLTDSWRKSIVNVELHSPFLSIFPNVSGLEFIQYPPSLPSSFLAQISAHPSPIRRFELESLADDFDENDLILDVLSKNSNKFNGGMEKLNLDAFCSMETIIRFIEDSKFAEKFDMEICVKNLHEYSYDPIENESVYAENPGSKKFNNWLRSKEIPQTYDKGKNVDETEFVYRSTQFHLRFREF